MKNNGLRNQILAILILFTPLSIGQVQIYMSELIGKSYQRVVDPKTGEFRVYDFTDADNDGWAAGVQKQFLPNPADPANPVAVKEYTLVFEISDIDQCGNCMIFQFENKTKRYFSIQHDGGDFWLQESDEKFEKSDEADIFYPVRNNNASDMGEDLREIMSEGFSDERYFNWDDAIDGDDLVVYGEIGEGFTFESVSSVLPEDDNFDYNGENAFDNDPYTTWFSDPEENDQYPLDESIIFKGWVYNEAIWILNGIQYSSEDFENNSRVKTMQMFVNGDYFGTITLLDVMGAQRVPLDGIDELQHGDEAITIEFRIIDVYAGNEYPEVGISEIYTTGG